MRLFYRGRVLIILVLMTLLITACGSENNAPPSDEVQVEVPVQIEEPAAVEEPPSLEPSVSFEVYSGAEYLNNNNFGPQIRVHRYITDEPVEDVLAFYQAQYPDFEFDVLDEGRSFILYSGLEVPDGMTELEQKDFYSGEVITIQIMCTDETYFNQMAFMPSSYLPEDVLELMPENVTLIEISVGN